MNIVQDPWLPFRFIDGTVKTLPMSAITDSQVVDFALPRADFQGAAYQFAIGLLQTVFAPEDSEEWHDRYRDPPTQSELQMEFDRVSHAFNTVGDGPLFMQDFDPLESIGLSPVSGLLIESPGANTIKLNTDHFIKRGGAECLSLEMAVVALFTLQINAPSGGQGHRTGLRGGGPLTTLVVPQQMGTTLWRRLWLNVINRDDWRYENPDIQSGDVFPWLAPTRVSDKTGVEVFANDVHPLHMFWSMPRRIRLTSSNKNDTCMLSGIACTKIVEGYRTKNFGYNYSGTWSHPLTPYRYNIKKPDEDHLSTKGQQGGVTYKIWDLLTMQSDEDGHIPAAVVGAYSEIHSGFDHRESEVPSLWVFGYDMDNMKARGWYSVNMPLFIVKPEKQDRLLVQVNQVQKLASDVLWQCRTQIKAAWFERPGDTKGDLSYIDLAFWQRTESEFFDTVAYLVDAISQDEQGLTPEQASHWLKSLRNTACDLFDEFALSELYGDRAMSKKIKARQMLTGWLYGSKLVKAFQQANDIESKREG